MKTRNGLTLLLFSVMLWFSAPLLSQSSHLLGFHAGASGMALRDQGMSPLSYSGMLLSGAVSYHYTREGKEVLFDFSHQRGMINNAFANRCRYRSLAFSNQTLYPFYRQGIHTLFGGWSNHNHFQLHHNELFTNFSERSDYFTTFGVLVAYRSEIEINQRKVLFDLPVDVAMLGFYLRPSFISNAPKGYVEPDGEGFRGFLNSIDPFVPWNDWLVGAHPQATLVLKNGNGVSLGYRFQWLGLNEPARMSMANGFWSVSLKTKLR